MCPNSVAAAPTGYAKFLLEEVKPFIEREYRTLTGSQYMASVLFVGRLGLSLSRAQTLATYLAR